MGTNGWRIPRGRRTYSQGSGLWIELVCGPRTPNIAKGITVWVSVERPGFVETLDRIGAQDERPELVYVMVSLSNYLRVLFS